MKEIKLKLDALQKRPVIKIMNLDAMIDTGAEISVCNLSEEVFELIFDYKQKEEYSIYGFGGECEGTKYIVRKLEIGGMIFADIPFFVPKERMKDRYKFILAAPIFDGLYYAFDMAKHEMIIRV